MRVYNQGAVYRVAVSSSEVYQFSRRWPCSNLPDRSVSFTFDSHNGDLVDISPEDADGSALSALADDAKAYGAKRLGLTL